MKLCKDCKWYGGGDMCQSPRALRSEISMVDGKELSGGYGGWRTSCKLQREDGWVDYLFLGTCGKRARWFKLKENPLADCAPNIDTPPSRAHG